jgi:hypothetical protein
VEPPAFVLGRIRQGQGLGYEGAKTGGDEDAAGFVPVMGRLDGEDGAPPCFFALVELFYLLPEADDRVVLHGLIDEVAREVLGQDPGEAGDVVDVLLRVERGELAAEDLERVDELDGHLPHAGVKRGEEAGRAAADDEDVGGGGHAALGS